MNYDELVAFFQAQTGLKGSHRREGVWEFQGIPESDVDALLEGLYDLVLSGELSQDDDYFKNDRVVCRVMGWIGMSVIYDVSGKKLHLTSDEAVWLRDKLRTLTPSKSNKSMFELLVRKLETLVRGDS